MRSDTAFFSAAVIGRRFVSGLASGLLSVAAAAAGFLLEEDRREVERDDGVADAPRISPTSINALISAWRRSISLWRSAMACAMTFMKLEGSGPVREMSTSARWLMAVASATCPVEYREPPGSTPQIEGCVSNPPTDARGYRSSSSAWDPRRTSNRVSASGFR